jgi:hypothetical protein
MARLFKNCSLLLPVVTCAGRAVNTPTLRDMDSLDNPEKTGYFNCVAALVVYFFIASTCPDSPEVRESINQ